MPASNLVPKKLLKVLVAHLNLPDDNLTNAEFWGNIARLGGFIGRSGDGNLAGKLYGVAGRG